jgi:colicin import membrane protein
MKIDWTISTLGHATLLAWGLVSFSIKPYETPPEGLPVDIISETDFSQITAGAKKAPPAPKPRPLVEKIAEKKPVEDPKAKITEKQEIKEAKLEERPPTPEPRPKPPEKPIEAKQQQQKPPEPKPRPTEKQQQPKVDEIAEALKKEEAKKREEQQKQQQRAEQLKKAIAELQKVEQEKKKLEQQPHFDPTKIAALLDKRDPQRHQATGDMLNQTASLGLPSAISARLSQSEIDALRARLGQLWNPPAGAANPDELVVVVRVRLTRDGRLAGPPQVITSGSSLLFMTARDSAIRALFRGQPFTMLRPEHYDQWKDIEITFDPRDMMRG